MYTGWRINHKTSYQVCKIGCVAKISTLQVTGSLEHLRFSTVTNMPSVEPLDKEL